ncbi:SurA N-terminal domain-containing protein [bacterium]|nr:SurA N-terminal domain-containing protein [bacterium]
MLKIKILFVLSVIILLITSGYLLIDMFGEKRGYPSQIGEEDVLAEVNNYWMTVEEFKGEVRSLSSTEKRKLATYQGKKQFLDTIIKRELLLQEAQRQGLDKDKDFMKTIEKYWEQALLQTLLRKKSREIVETVRVSKQEIEDYRLKMSEEIWAKVVLLNSNRATKQLIEEEDMQKGIEKLKKFVLDNEEWQWYNVGDLDWRIEKVLFSLSEGEISRPVKIYSEWAVMKAGKKRKKLKVEKLSDEKIAMIIKKLKETEKMEDWLNGLDEQARIIQNRKILEALDFNTEM